MSANTHPPLWMCLHFSRLPLDIFSRAEKYQKQKNKDQAIVILKRQRVFCMNETALRLGIQLGNNMDTTYALSDKVLSFERNEDKEASTLSYLAQWAYQFTPNVSIKSPDALLLDIAACLKLFKGLNALTNKVERSLYKLGYQVVITTNPSPSGALLLALAQATNKHPENAITCIKQVSIQYLQTDKKIITALTQMGILNLGTLLALPGGALIRRFGGDFRDYLARISGAKPDPQKFISPSVRFQSNINFLSDITNLSALAFPINRLLTDLSDFLSARQLAINHFTWYLSHRHSSHKQGRKSLSISLASPVNERKIFLSLTQLKLDQINDIKEIDSITLVARQFFPVATGSGDLFQNAGLMDAGPLKTSLPKDGLPKESPDRLDKENRLLNMLNAKLGPDHYFGLSQANDHRPEKAWQKVALKRREERQEERQEYWLPKEQGILPRPTFLLPRPKVLPMVDNQPYLDGKLTLLRGPERIDYGWWDQPLGKSLTRDYHIARQEDGSLYWIFQYMATGHWYLHGIFS